MLFVMGCIPLPKGNWLIIDIVRESPARTDHLRWLQSLQTAIEKIPKSLPLVKKMLSFDPKIRIEAEVLSKKARTICEISITGKAGFY